EVALVVEARQRPGAWGLVRVPCCLPVGSAALGVPLRSVQGLVQGTASLRAALGQTRLRRSSDRHHRRRSRMDHRAEQALLLKASYPRRRAADRDFRSEEHTSELQSRFDLVCRLLLEKKKPLNNTHKHLM